MKNRIYLQLGRAGDVLNILPLCRRDFERSGIRPLLMVAEQYASLLEGVSYVEPAIWSGRFEEVIPATMAAQQIATERGLAMVCTQIYGERLGFVETCSSFLRESWARVPDAPAWGSLPLVFDRRDPAREAAVIEQLRGRQVNGRRPYIVLALSGTSSPFAQAREVRRALMESKTHDVIDISGFIAPRLFDLLGLLEGADALVAIDSAPLHLAAAVPKLPVVALITREPSSWHGSSWRPQQVERIFYDELERLAAFFQVFPHVTTRIRQPRILHTWTHYEAGAIEPETLRRIQFAKRTWQDEAFAYPHWHEVEFKVHDSKRDSGLACGDPRPVPFWRDLIDLALERAEFETDIIALTNADVCFTPGLTGNLLDVCKRSGAAFTHRWDFHLKLEQPFASEADVIRGEWYPGSDAFFFTVAWWRAYGWEYPDMLVGREQNDEVLRQLIKRHGGLELHAAIYHEKHASYWEHHGNREKNAGNIFNRALARRWFLRTGYGPNDPEWWKIPSR